MKVFKRLSVLFLVITLTVSLFGSINVSAGKREGATNMNIWHPADDEIYYYEGPWNEDGTFDYYYYPIYDDPNYIKDEEFFGVWNEAENAWSTLPMLSYSEFPGLSKVESAAKSGEYDIAKEHLQAYYINIKEERTPNEDITTLLSNCEKMLNSYARNTYPCWFLSSLQLGYVTAKNEWQKVSVDVEFALKTSGIGVYNGFNIQVAAIDKYYTKAEIYSKDAGIPEYEPVLKVRANGVDIICPVTKDAEIRAGACEDINYGFEPIITIEEHGCYDDTEKTFDAYDETTSRAHMTFDISMLSSTDNIESAKVEFYCRTDAPKGVKELNVQWYKNESWVEDSVTWSYFTDQMYFSCNDVEAWDYLTHVTPNIKGKVCGYLRNGEPAYLYKGYYQSDFTDERYAYHWIRHEMSTRNSLENTLDCFCSLDRSNHISGICDGIFYCIESTHMTPERFCAILKSGYMLCKEQVDADFGVYNNNFATFATGAVYEYITRFRELAVADEWMKLLKADNTRVMSDISYSDGMCIEMAMQYHNTLMSTYETPVRYAQSMGTEFPYEEEVLMQIYNTLYSCINQRGPYCGYNFGDAFDTYNDVITSLCKKWYNFGLFDDPHIAYIATGGVEGYLPENPSTHFTDGARAFMRSGWGQNDLMLGITNNVKTNASHGHRDALSISVFAYGTALLTDQGYGTLQTGDSWNYMRSPLQHNVMTVNDTEDWLNTGSTYSHTTLKSGNGLEYAYEANMQFDYIEYAQENFITTDISQRSVTFVRDGKFWIVTDYAVPVNPHIENVFAQNWHMYPGANPSWDEETKTLQSNNTDEANVKLYQVEYDEIDEVRKVKTWYSEASGQMMESEKGMVLKTKSGPGRFTTIIMPMELGDDIKVETSVVDTGLDPDIVNATYFKVINPDTLVPSFYYFYHLNDVSKKTEAKMGKYATDATTMLVEEDADGNVKSVFMIDGSYIKNSELENEYLFKSETAVKSISYKKTGDTLYLASTNVTDDDINAVTMYGDGASNVYFITSGSMLDTKEQGGYLYFGEQPIVDAEDKENPPSEDEEEDDSDDRNQGVSGGSSGGGGGGSSGGSVKPPVIVTPEVTPTVPQIPVVEKKKYDDVSENDWFFDYVEELSEKGIVSGDGTGNFAPNRNVTREQFLKMLIGAMSIETEEVENTFTDVADAWYKPYVLKAKGFGIVNGISDTEFGIGTNITRQDMAVMISRTIEKTGITVKATDVEPFADGDIVSNYAKEAVVYMKSIGLIEGFNNEYRPHDNLTRAEAVKVISELLKLL